VKIVDIYSDTATALDGKRYKESQSYGYDFLSRHKSQCRKLVKQWVDEYEGEIITYKLYGTSSYDVKENGQIYSVCRGCKNKIKNLAWHFEEDEITPIKT